MIGGNATAHIQVKDSVKNAIGEGVKSWNTVQDIQGWLDLATGDSKYITYDAKVQESTHVFVSGYYKLDSSITSENSRMIINGAVYDVMLIDDPMGLHQQLEIYLKYTGGQ